MNTVANDNFEHCLPTRILIPFEALDLYMVEQMRIAMGAVSREEVVARSFVEFAEGCGLEFHGRVDPRTGNHDIDEPGYLSDKDALIAWVAPSRKHGFMAALKRRTRTRDTCVVMQKAMRWAYEHYVFRRATKRPRYL